MMGCSAKGRQMLRVGAWISMSLLAAIAPGLRGVAEAQQTLRTPSVTGDQLLFFYDARASRVPFLMVGNPSDQRVFVDVAFHSQDLSGRIASDVVDLGPAENRVIDPTSFANGAAVGTAGLAIMTPVLAVDDLRPVVPPQPLVGGFTLVNLALGSGFGQNPMARLAVQASGFRAAPGTLVDGGDVKYQRFTPDELVIPAYFDPATLAPPEKDGNRVLFASFADDYGSQFEVDWHRTPAQIRFVNRDGVEVASRQMSIDGIVLSDLQSLAGATSLDGASGKVFFDVEVAGGNLFGVFSQSLSTFAAGQRMPARGTGPADTLLAIDTPDVRGDQLLYLYDARSGRVAFLSVTNPSTATVFLEVAFHPEDLSGPVATSIVELGSEQNRVIDPTSFGGGGANGTAGIVTMTPVRARDDLVPVVPPEPLMGGFTLANTQLGSGFGQNPMGRMAMNGSARTHAAAGTLVDGVSVQYQGFRPDVLMIPSYLDPNTLAPATNDGNRVLLASFGDTYEGGFTIYATPRDVRASFVDRDGKLLTNQTRHVGGVLMTDLQTLAGSTPVGGASGKVFLDVSTGAGNWLGLFSQSLGTFAAGQRLPGTEGVPGLVLDCSQKVDALESNNTIASAADVQLDTRYSDLVSCGSDEDYFRFTLNAPTKVTARTSIRSVEGDPQWGIFFLRGDGEWYTFVGTSAAPGADRTLEYSFLPGTYVARILSQDGSASIGYDLILETSPPCPDDANEDNDFPDQPTAIAAGLHTNLRACQTDFDYYSLTVSAGQTVTVTLDADPFEGSQTRRLQLFVPGAGSAIETAETNPVSVSLTATGNGDAWVAVLFFEDGVQYDLNVEVGS